MKRYILLIILYSTTALSQENIFPQFDFTLLRPFSPGNKPSSIPRKFGPGTEIKLKNSQSVRLYRVSGSDNYKFPILIQYSNDEILDMFVRPPSYLMHDFFHRDLITKYGKQNEYTYENGSGYYYWATETKDVYYQGSCTITCFPIFYSEVAKKSKLPSTYKSIGKLMEESLSDY